MIISRKTARQGELVSIQFVDGVARGTLSAWSRSKIAWVQADPTTRATRRCVADASRVVAVIAIAREIDD